MELIGSFLEGLTMQWILQDVPLGKNIKEMRTAKGLTQAQVVEQMQLTGSPISRRTYSHIESGIRNIKASDLKALKFVLDATFEDFFV
jgi:transcriptional regulator with XRE-family HTH domain